MSFGYRRGKRGQAWHVKEVQADDAETWYPKTLEADAWWKRTNSNDQSEDQETRVDSSDDDDRSRASSPSPWQSPALAPASPGGGTPREDGEFTREGAPQLPQGTSQTTRTKLSTKAVAFVPKLSTKAAAFVPKVNPISAPASDPTSCPKNICDDSLSKVRASVDATFGSCLMGMKVAENTGGFDIRLELPPPPPGTSVQGARKLAADILKEALQHFGQRVVRLDVADDLCSVNFQYLPVDPQSQCYCWEFMHHGYCPRMQWGNQCRWPHMKAVSFDFTFDIQEPVVVPPRSQFVPAFFGNMQDGFPDMAAPMQPAYTTTINGQQHTVMVVQVPMPMDFGNGPTEGFAWQASSNPELTSAPGFVQPESGHWRGTAQESPDQQLLVGGCSNRPLLPTLPTGCHQVGTGSPGVSSPPAAVPKRQSWADIIEDEDAEIPTMTPRSDFGDF